MVGLLEECDEFVAGCSRSEPVDGESVGVWLLLFGFEYDFAVAESAVLRVAFEEEFCLPLDVVVFPRAVAESLHKFKCLRMCHSVISSLDFGPRLYQNEFPRAIVG